MACAVNADRFSNADGITWTWVVFDWPQGVHASWWMVIGGCCSNSALSWQVEQLKDDLTQSEAQGEELRKRAAELQQEVSAVRHPENRLRTRTALLPSPERTSRPLRHQIGLWFTLTSEKPTDWTTGRPFSLGRFFFFFPARDSVHYLWYTEALKCRIIL